MNSDECRLAMKSGSFSEAVKAFYDLVNSHELVWRDLLNGLEYPGLIAEAAAIKLHLTLRIPVGDSGLILQRTYWEETLQKNKLNPDTLLSENHSADASN